MNEIQAYDSASTKHIDLITLKSSENRKTAAFLNDPDLEEKTSSKEVNFTI